MKKLVGLAATSIALMIAAPQMASAQTFATTGNMADNGPYGDAIFFKPTDLASTLQLRVTGWQSNQLTNAITTAWVGAYGPGLGVTGLNDLNGASGYHQIDNAGGYTDFLMLQFNAPVVLKSLNLNSFTMGTSTVKDNDLAFYAASVPELRWDSAVDLTSYVTAPSLWSTVAGTGKDGTVATGAAVASRQWLVGAAFNSANNDGFKIASITVSSPVAAVPEPAAWAMMILGVGLIGAALRTRRAGDAAATPERA